MKEKELINSEKRKTCGSWGGHKCNPHANKASKSSVRGEMGTTVLCAMENLSCH